MPKPLSHYPDTLFALGSLSKGTTAEVITLLVNEGDCTGTIRY